MMRRLILAALLLVAIPAMAEPPVPAEVQMAIFSKVWTLDRNFSAAKGITILVVYQSRYRASVNAQEEIAAAAGKIRGLHCGLADLDDGGISFDERMRLAEPALVYVTPLRAIDIGLITRVTREHHVRTMTGVAQYVEQGISLGVAVRNDRPLILVNLSAARAEGADFSSQLLKLARLVSEVQP